MSHLVVFFVFFFKQKTAYEMRISDWSSDVCSSDLSRVASDLRDRGATVFALKSDFLSPEVSTETDLQRDLQLPGAPSDLILRLAALQPVYVFIDQLDALASPLDLRSGRLNVLINLVSRIGGTPTVHLLLSARTFETSEER